MSDSVGSYGSAVFARERVPRLLLRVAVLTTLGLTVAVAIAVGIVRHAYAVQGEQRAIERARLTIAVALDRQLRATDVTGPVTVARSRELRRRFAHLVLDDTTQGAAVYSNKGIITFAAGQFRSTTKARSQQAVEAASTGAIVARINRARSGSDRVLTTYVPIATGNRAARGVVALERDYGPIAAAAQRSTLLIAGVLEGVLVVLLLVLTPTLLRASRRIRAQVRALDYLATHDELTRLPNRIGFRRALDQHTTDEGPSTAVVLVDLNGFHEINEALGPDRADTLLGQVGDRLRSVDGPFLVARLGEDEFGLLVPAGDDADIGAVERAVHTALASPFRVGHQRIGMDATIGCAIAPANGTEADALLRRAGVALSLAKERQVPFERYDANDDHSDIARIALASDLREAVHNGQLTVHYQPQADLATGAIRGAEALVRWQHPTRGLLTAAEFISVAETMGLIGEIGRFVLGCAARQWQAWNARGLRLDVAVNLSTLDLLDPHLHDEIEELLGRHGVPPEYLVLEITERTVLRDEGRSRMTLESLRRIGARLAIDDYGTGYSSLAQLRNLEARQIKLDRTFTARIPGDRANEAIIRSTVELAHALNATIVAEGVETDAQWNHLAAAGCDIAQGYLIGKPLCGDEFGKMFAVSPRLRGAA